MQVVQPSELRAIARAIFSAVGAPDEIASLVAGSLVDANLAGHDSHGIIRVAQYVQSIRDGRIDPAATPTVAQEVAATAVMDGRWGFGQVTARRSMELAVAKAKQSGVAAVAAINCNHIGRLGEWSELAAASGVVGFCTVALHGGPQAAAPFGGAGRVMSTNPISFGVPAGQDRNVVVDFATTAVAEGKLRVARAKGVQVPPGCIVDKDGNPTTDPNDYYNGGALLPFGGHKGYGLAVVSELLGLAVTGALHSKNGTFSSGAMFVCINPAAFGPLDAYGSAAESIATRITSVPPAPGFDAVLLPGEPEQRARRERANGIPIDDNTWQTVQQIMAEVGAKV